MRESSGRDRAVNFLGASHMHTGFFPAPACYPSDMTTPTGAAAAGDRAPVVLEYMSPAMLPPAILRHVMWYFLTMASIVFFSTAAAVAAMTPG
jgi:hypothetical protein